MVHHIGVYCLVLGTCYTALLLNQHLVLKLPLPGALTKDRWTSIGTCTCQWSVWYSIVPYRDPYRTRRNWETNPPFLMAILSNPNQTWTGLNRVKVTGMILYLSGLGFFRWFKILNYFPWPNHTSSWPVWFGTSRTGWCDSLENPAWVEPCKQLFFLMHASLPKGSL